MEDRFRIVLRLVGTFDARVREALNRCPTRIYGSTTKGEAVTLQNCFPSGGASYETQTIELRVESVFVGTLLPPGEVHTRECYFEFAGLEEWLGLGPLGLWTPNLYENEVESLEAVPFGTTGGLSLSLERRAYVEREGVNRRIVQRAGMNVIASEPKPLGTFVDVAAGVRSFLTLAMSFKTSVTTCECKSAVFHLPEHVYKPDEINLAVYGWLLGPDVRSIVPPPHTFLIDFASFGAELPARLSAWLDQCNNLFGVYLTYWYAAHEERLPIELRFQLLAQAGEALHKKVIGGTKLNKKTFAAVVDAAVAAVPTEHQGWVRGVLGTGNSIAFKERYRALYTRAIEVIGEFPVSENDFVEAVGARNLFAHGSSVSGEKLSEIINMVNWLTLVLEAVLLRTTGFDANALLSAFTRNRSSRPAYYVAGRSTRFADVRMTKEAPPSQSGEVF
jgi:hypothetical protein